MKEKLESHKIAFITEKVGLTPEEAKEFWPVYQEYDDKRSALREDIRPEKVPDDLSEEEAMQRINQLIKHDQQASDLRAEYTKKFLDVLPATKVLKLHRAEMEFKREMLRKVRERMHKRRHK